MESVAEVEFIALSVAGDSARKELDGWTATDGQVQRHLKSFRRRAAGAAFYFSCGGLECPSPGGNEVDLVVEIKYGKLRLGNHP